MKRNRHKNRLFAVKETYNGGDQLMRVRSTSHPITSAYIAQHNDVIVQEYIRINKKKIASHGATAINDIIRSVVTRIKVVIIYVTNEEFAVIAKEFKIDTNYQHKITFGESTNQPLFILADAKQHYDDKKKAERGGKEFYNFNPNGAIIQ